MTAEIGLTEVYGFHASFNEDGDKISIDDPLNTKISYKNGDMIFKRGSATLILKDVSSTTNSSDLAESADLLSDENFAKNESSLDDIKQIKFEMGDYRYDNNTSYDFYNNSNSENVEITFAHSPTDF